MYWAHEIKLDLIIMVLYKFMSKLKNYPNENWISFSRPKKIP